MYWKIRYDEKFYKILEFWREKQSTALFRASVPWGFTADSNGQMEVAAVHGVLPLPVRSDYS